MKYFPQGTSSAMAPCVPVESIAWSITSKGFPQCGQPLLKHATLADVLCVSARARTHTHTHSHTHTQYRFNAVLVLQACWLVLWNRLENGENSHSANQRVLSPGV